MTKRTNRMKDLTDENDIDKLKRQRVRKESDMSTEEASVIKEDNSLLLSSKSSKSKLNLKVRLDTNNDGTSMEGQDVRNMSMNNQCESLFKALETGQSMNSTKEFVSLFSNDNKAHRKELLECVSCFKFQKNHARRMFSALLPTLQHVINSEAYVPLSAYDDDDSGVHNIDDLEIESDSKEIKNRKNKGRRIKLRTSSPQSQQLSSTRSSNQSYQYQNLEITPDVASTEALQFMKYSALLVQAYLHNLIQRRPSLSNENSLSSISNNSIKKKTFQKKYAILEEVFNVVEILHDTLFSLHSCGIEGMQVQGTISSVCEQYYYNHFADRELLVTQLVPLLVVKTLDGNAKTADLKRLYNIRFALCLFDFQQDSIAYLRTLLLRTTSSPLYLTTLEGRKIISFLYRLDCHLIQDLHQAMKVQIPLANKATLQHYGDIYFRAWKEAQAYGIRDINTDADADDNYDSEKDDETSIQKFIEENVLQDLMHAALHISTPHMAKSIRIILEPFHSQKKKVEIDQLLYKMYTPILWRALAATNSLVRINASSILAITFPLHNPIFVTITNSSSSRQISPKAPTKRKTSTPQKKHIKDMVQKTIDVLMSLLQDIDSKVRVAGCNATIKILGPYWDALPSRHIRTLLNEIIMRHASDKSSAAVRVQAIHGITALLDAPASHGVLRPLLPHIGNLIHDSVEKVRLASVKMLLKIKKVKNIKYYHVVPSQHILARLAAEGDFDVSIISRSNRTTTATVATKSKNITGPVPRALTELLLNSYFPQGSNVKGSHQMERTLVFLTKNPGAASVFYANLSCILDVNNICKLIVMLVKVLKLGVENDLLRLKKEKAEKSTQVEFQSNTMLVSGRKRRRDNDESDSYNDNTWNDSSIHRTVENDMDVYGITNDIMEVCASNTFLMARVAETICCLWDSIDSSLRNQDYGECNHFLQSAFGGSTLADLYSHFATKHEVKNYSNEVDFCEEQQRELGRSEDCQSICSAILRCAGWLTPNKISGLAEQLSSYIANRGSVNANERATMNLPSHIALLCLWGLHLDVSISLSNAIGSAFDEGDYDDTEKEFENNWDNSVESLGQIRNPVTGIGGDQRVKRKKSGVRSSKKKQSSLIIPELSPLAALNVLRSILLGADPSCISARNILLNSDRCCSLIENALEKSIVIAEKILISSESTRNTRYIEKIKLVLTACEAYGCLALHKQASADGPLQFCSLLSNLLMWISNHVVPALLKRSKEDDSCSPFRELNLSRISAISSDDPASPTRLSLLIDPPRRRSNLASTPSRVDSSFVSMEENGAVHFTLQRKPCLSLYAKAMGISMLKSALFIFAEWLIIGGPGADEISSHGAKWLQVIDCDFKSIHAKCDLFPTFCQLSLVLVKHCMNYELLKEIIQCCDNLDKENEETLHRTMCSILSMRGKKSYSHANMLVSVVVSIIEEFVNNSAGEKESILAVGDFDLNDLIPREKKGVAVALTSIISIGSGIMGLVIWLKDRLRSSDITSMTIRMFILLCQQMPLAQNNEEVKQIIREIDVNLFDEENGERECFQAALAMLK